MAIAPITHITGTAVPVPGADIDTDRIIPARFLKCVTFDDLAEGMFYDERFNEDKSSKGHPIDDPKFAGATIMIAGPNFGCGSSREGMPCVSMSEQDNESLMELVTANPTQDLALDLNNMSLTYGDQSFSVTMPEGARQALVSGKWDAIAELVDNNEQIESVAAQLPYV